MRQSKMWSDWQDMTARLVPSNSTSRHAHENPMLQHLLHDRGEFSFETLVNTVGVDDHGTYSCFECIRACPLNKQR
jgi:hypothetical protein